MSEEATDLRSGFVRQRRNLIITSLVLLFSLIHETKPIRELSIPGIKIEFTYPVNIHWYIAIVFVYFFWRYYVYFRDIGDTRFRTAHIRRLERITLRHISRLFREKLSVRDELQADLEAALNIQNQNQQQGPLKPASKENWELNGITIHGRYELIRIEVDARFLTRLESGKKENWANDTHKRIVLAGLEALMLNIRAGLYVLMHTRILSEYFLPFGIASLPVLYLGYKVVVVYIRS